MSGWLRRLLVYLMPWYSERDQFERLDVSRQKLAKAERLQRDAHLRADAARARARMARH